MNYIAALLFAISQVESGGDDLKVGAAGEVGRLQILPATWKRHTRLSPKMAKYWAHSERIGKRILEEDRKWFLKQMGREPSVQEVYIMWKCGPGVFKKGKMGKAGAAALEGAERVKNLFDLKFDPKAPAVAARFVPRKLDVAAFSRFIGHRDTGSSIGELTEGNERNFFCV